MTENPCAVTVYPPLRTVEWDSGTAPDLTPEPSLTRSSELTREGALMESTQDHALYRFFDDDGNLLYVGITLDPGRRWRKHRGRPWWRFVADITVKQYASRAAVLRAERRAIITEHPVHNVLLNRGAQLADEPIDLFEIMCSPGFGSEPEHMPDICHDGCFFGLRISGSDLYYPYSWRRGLAHYQCERGHQWTCKWGHHRSGEALQNAGRAQEVVS